MAGVFEGLKAIDLTRGVAGPVAAMVLADRGADVIRIEGIEPDPFPALDNGLVWNRGKRSAVLDFDNAEDRAAIQALARDADILIEDLTDEEARHLGLDHETLAAHNPKLIHCSITPYGDTSAAGRPRHDQLVAARAGLQWEARGWYGGPLARVKGRDTSSVEVDVPDSVRIGSDRDGPIFTATPATSVVTAYHALLGISAALYSRDHSGRGQHVTTSMLQAIIMMNCASWMRPAEDDIPNFYHGVHDRRQTWGLVTARDGYMCIWVSPPRWFGAAGAGDALAMPDPELGNMRHAMMPIEERVRVLDELAPIFRKFDVADWVRIAAENGNISCQPVRTPEEALCDPALIAEGTIVEYEHPELGTLRQVGAPYRLHDSPVHVRWPAPARGAHTEEVRAEAARLRDGDAGAATPADTAAPAGGPLAGVRIIDFGGAVAGPWATQLLADMGADVVKVDPARQDFWMRSHMAIAVNRTKRWIGLDAKTEEGAEIARELVRGADVVMLNLRPQAAKKLGFDHATLSKLNPRLIYCATRGFEDGPRSALPGNDQTGNSLGGTVWDDGGCEDGGRPWFGATSNGDLGNGYLASIGIVQALHDRERTGKGQAVDASILNASLFNNSRVSTTRDGKAFDRLKLDADQTGFSALYRLYRCRDDGWICIAAFSDAEWAALASAIPAIGQDERFSDAARRAEHDAVLTDLLRETFATASAAEWFARLDAAGVPCEISAETYSQTVLDDPELIERGWIVHGEGNPVTGPIDLFGRSIAFSGTPAEPGKAPPVLWQHTREVLRELGYSDDRIDRLAASGAIILPAADSGAEARTAEETAAA